MGEGIGAGRFLIPAMSQHMHLELQAAAASSLFVKHLIL